ncbi:uncharacterized protein LOC129908194 [Episyrphus balteatus]|uniref:uncharacterized protein LOC129908194 n=1 Tax=Episyrphus balteatus TaxID=286459 RepID=UPI002484FF26|nr:uncharacterized protein LOC129908194 [Episyrphus balteatus]
MPTEFIESEKIWKAPAFKISPSCLGKTILTNLSQSDPKRIFEINHDNGTRLTVQDIRQQTITIAQNLLGLGVEKGDVVILYSKSNERITPITFACYTIGAPVNFFETNLDHDAISYNLGMLDPTVIIYEEEYMTQLFTALKFIKLENLKHILSIDSSETISVNEVLFQRTSNIKSFQPPDLGDPTKVPAAYMFTAGVTGMPRIIQLSHAMIIQGLYNSWQVDSESRVFCLNDLRWICQVLLMMQPAFYGSLRIYSSRPEYDKRAKDGRDVIANYRVTHYIDVPKGYLSVLQATEFSRDPACLSSLRSVLIGGESASKSLVEYSAKIVPSCKVINGYRMTEMAGVVVSDEHVKDDDGAEGGSLKNGLMAKIIGDNNESLGHNQMGRLCLKSVFPFLGYFKDEKANKELFLEGGWFDTGDYSYMDSNNSLNIVARYENLVRSSGTILIPSDVENIINSHPNVMTSALVGHPNLKNSQEELGTVFVVLKRNYFSSYIEEELRKLIKDKLTKEQYQIVRYFKIIPEMPLTNCGKTDRWALKVLANEESRMLC